MLYLVIAATAVVAHSNVPDTIPVAGYPATAASNIASSPATLNAGIASELVVLPSETALTVLLHFLLRAINEVLAL